MPRIDQAYAIEDLRRLAQRRLPRALFDFYDGGAEDELSLRANRDAFARHALRPRVLVDVSQVGLQTTLLGAPSTLPLAIAPTGALGFGWPGADIAIAQVASAAGVPFTLSSSGTTSIEKLAKAAPGRLWFQAYVLRDRVFFERMIQRAEASGYEALMITVDLPVGGKRERDFRNHFSIPFKFTPRNLLDFAQHPRWALRIARHGMPAMETLAGLAARHGGARPSASAIASSVGRNYDAAFDWARLEAVRKLWPRKLIVKGVAHPGDAARLVALGVDALVVSNHGGRQLDGGAATLDLLPAVVAAVAAASSAPAQLGMPVPVPVLIDGGVRRGADIVKALALGAQGVLVGRATLWGAMAAGGPGAQRALDILRDELLRTLQLCGVQRVADISRDLLLPSTAHGRA